MATYLGQIFKLKADAEVIVRQESCRAGGNLAMHFPEFEGGRFRCFRVPGEGGELDSLWRSPSNVVFLTTAHSYLLSAGVDAVEVEEHPALQRNRDAEDELHEIARGDLQDPHADLPDGVFGLIAMAKQRLQTFFTVCRGGTVSRRYSPEPLLAYLELASNLKPSAKVNNVLACSADLFFGRDSISFQNQLRSGEIPMPSLAVLRVARLRLDLLSMVWQQKLFLQFDWLIYVLVDASPQLGYDFLVVLEDQIRLPKASVLSLWQRMKLDLNECWHTVLQALSSLGLGRATTVHKTIVTSNLLVMSVSNTREFHDKRRAYKGFCTDHGVEHRVGDMPVGIANMPLTEDNATDAGFLYPESLTVIDFLHTLWGGYETACKDNPMYERFEDVLQACVAFTSSTQLMRKFRGICLDPGPEEQKLFSTKAVIHIDWRWESMTKALDVQVPIHSTFRQRFDEQKMLSTESSTKLLQSSVVKDVRKALDSMPELEFMGCAEFYRVVGKIIFSMAGKCEICDCHADLWQRDRSYAKRRRLLREQVHREQCVWMGRRLPWFINRGFNEFMTELREGTSDRLQHVLAAADVSLRGQLASGLERMRTKLIEIYEDKFAYLFTIPFYAIGAFFPAQGGLEDEARNILRYVFFTVDEILTKGESDKLDRVSRKLWVPGARVRAVGEAYCADPTKALDDFPVLYVALQEYALMPMVSRRVEKWHATIKRVGSYKWGISLPYVCALVREPATIEQLHTSVEFKQFCIDNFHARSLLDKLLHLRIEPDKLKKMLMKEKIGQVYQCTIASEYADASDKHEVQQAFVRNTSGLKPLCDKLTDDESASVTYIKNVLRPGIFYTMPADLLQQCFASAFVKTPGGCVGCVQRLLDATLAPDETTAFSNDMVTVLITNTKPENRKTVQPSHVRRRRTLVNLVVRSAASMNTFGTDLVLAPAATVGGDIRTVDCLGFVEQIHRFVRQVHQWKTDTIRALPNIKPMAPALQDNLGLSLPILDIADTASGVTDHAMSSTAVALPPVLDVRARNSALQFAVDQLVLHGNFVGQSVVAFPRTGLDMRDIEALRQSGVVKISWDEFGEAQLAVRPEAIEWSASHRVIAPLPICRVIRPVKCLLKCTKIDLLVMLTRQGWQNDNPTEPLLPTSPLKCRLSVKPALSYLAAMACKDMIFAKHVPQIHHNQHDHYYRSLIKLEADQLAQMLLEEEGKTDKWFKQYFEKWAPDESSDSGSEGDDLPPRPKPPARHAGDHLPLPVLDVVDDAYIPWTRKIVSVEGDPAELKVYTSNRNVATGKQEAWLTCLHHADERCIRWRTLYGTQAEFCAYMYVWHQDGIQLPHIRGRDTHMSHEPDPDTVKDVASRIQLRDF